MPWWFRRRRADAPTFIRPSAMSRGIRVVDINGTLYAADEPYALSIGSEEDKRLNFQHAMLHQATGKNFFAPIYTAHDTSPRRYPWLVLDVGTGTGIWAEEMAMQFPDSQVYATDMRVPEIDERLSRWSAHPKEFPKTYKPHLRPKNYHFVQVDVLKGVPTNPNSFDYVHQRLLVNGIPADAWQGVVVELARVAKPGGFVELVETGACINPGPALAEINGIGSHALAERGIMVERAEQIGSFLTQAGLANVQQIALHLPLGVQPDMSILSQDPVLQPRIAQISRSGAMMGRNYLAGASNMRPLVTAMGLVNDARLTELLAAAERELQQPECPTFSTFYIAWAQKM